MRKLSWIIAGILCTTPAALLAAELGAPKLESHLTEKLKVMIPITGLNGTPLDEIKVRLAPESYYQQAGIPMDPLAGNIMFQVKSGSKGPYVLVSSKRSISDPILSMLLEVQTSHGKFIKEYDLLLNPPVRGESTRSVSTQFQQIAPQVASSTQTTRSSLINSAPSGTSKMPVWHTIKDVPDIKLEGEYKVKRGDTLYDIAKQTASGSDVAVRPLMQAIINANPHAFVDGNGNTLMAGATLKVPAPTTAKAAAPTTSAAPEENQPKLQLLSPDTETAGKKPASETQSANSSETTPPADQSSQTTGADQTQAKLPAINSTDTPTSSDTAAATVLAQQNNEAIASIDAKSEAMSHQIDMLNTQLKQVQDQIVVRNQSIDQLQKKIHESQSQTQSLQKQLEEQKNSFWIQWGPYLAGGAGLLLIAMLLLLMFGRGRKNSNDRIEPMAAKQGEVRSSMQPESSFSTQAQADEKTLDEMSPIAPAIATAAAAGLAATSSMASIPPFNAQTLIEESRLLVSYNLHAQAIDMLQDAVSDHPDELSLYQELARIHAESKNEDALNEVLNEIDQRFGPENRPDLSDLQEQMAMQSAPIPIFENNESLNFPEPDAVETRYEQPLDVNPVEQESLDIDLPEPDSPVMPSSDMEDANVLEFSLDEPYETTAPKVNVEDQSLNIEEPKSIDFDLDMPAAVQLPDEEPSLALHDAGLSQTPDMDEAQPEITAPDTGAPVSSEQNDTRLGLVEAFLGVGDLESYKMIAEEIEGEGDPKVIAALRDIEKAHGI